MQQSKNDFDLTGTILALILILIFFAHFFIPSLSSSVTGESIYYIFAEFFLGIFFLYTGIKTVQKQRAQQLFVRWYTQPSILVAIAVFFAIPFYLLLGLGVNFGNPNNFFLVILLWLPSTVLLLAGVYFYIRGFLGHRKTQV